MKKLFSLLFALCLLASFVACGEETAKPASPETTAAPTGTTAAPAPTASAEAKAALDGKKVIFIGNSYTYWGNAVINKPNSIMEQKPRLNDQGIFYQICKFNGIDVSVTNWAFGAHNLTDIMSHECLCENEPCQFKDHLSYLEDAAYDYVCIQLSKETEYAGDIISHITPTMDIFREANPNVKFLLLVPQGTYRFNFVWKNELQTAADAGITVVNWGAMVDDIFNKRIEVPGATQQYFENSFVVSRAETDGHHQNMLAGYLTSLMTYCAITGDSAVGQPYAFVDDSTIHPNFDLEAYKAKQYTYDTYTNFIDIFRSTADMNGLQQLTDQYLVKYNGGN